MDEQEAIRLCQGGDKESFRFLVEAHENKAFRAACVILGDPQAAREVTQEAFLSAWNSIHTFNVGLPFRPWLYKIVVRCAVRRLQKKSIQVTCVAKSTEIEVPDPSPGPDRLTEALERRKLIRTAICGLSRQRQLIIKLYYYLEQPIAEIAESLGLPEGSVKSELFRARQELNDKLKGVL